MGPDYASALRRLYALGQGRMLPGRERLRAVLGIAATDGLLADAPVVLVGGTNGKGSLVAALSAVLSTGLSCGAFLKPHLKSVRERWRIADQPLSEEQFAHAAHAACDLIEVSGVELSFFEANVLLGRIAFSRARVAVEVWEVGLGGTHDACNVLDPCISVITNVQYDHQAILGDTLEQIAADKAGIARSGRALLLGPPRPGWEVSYAQYAPVIEAAVSGTGARFVPVSAAEVLGPLSADTAALLDAVLAELPNCEVDTARCDLPAGLARMHYRGRMEHTSIEGHPVLLDAAHNPDSLRWLALTLAPQMHVVLFGCQSTKDPRQMLQELAPITAALVPFAVPVLHPLPVDTITAAAAELGIPLAPGPVPASSVARDAVPAIPHDLPLDHTTELDPPDNSTHWIEAVRHAVALSRASGKPLLICGSIYYIGEILRAFEDGWVE